MGPLLLLSSSGEVCTDAWIEVCKDAFLEVCKDAFLEVCKDAFRRPSVNTLTQPHFSSSVLFCKFIQSIPDNQLVRQKLNCMTKIVESSLFQQAGERVSLRSCSVWGRSQPTSTAVHVRVPQWLATVLQQAFLRLVLQFSVLQSLCLAESRLVDHNK